MLGKISARLAQSFAHFSIHVYGIAFVWLAASPFIIWTIYDGYQQIRDTEQTAVAELQRLADEVARALTVNINATRGLLVNLSDRALLKEFQCDPWLINAMTNSHFVMAHESGELSCLTSEGRQTSPKTVSWLPEYTRSEAFVWEGLRFADEYSEWQVVSSYPILDGRARMYVGTAASYMQSRIKPRSLPNSDITVVDHTGRIVAKWPNQPADIGTVLPIGPRPSPTSNVPDIPPEIEDVAARNVIAYAAVPDTNWRVYTSQDRAFVRKAVQEKLSVAAAFLVTALGFVSFIAYVFTRSISRPIRALTSQSRNIVQGQTPNIGTGGLPRELVELVANLQIAGSAIGDLLTKLTIEKDALDSALTRYKRMVETVPVPGMVLWGDQVGLVNQALVELRGDDRAVLRDMASWGHTRCNFRLKDTLELTLSELIAYLRTNNMRRIGPVDCRLVNSAGDTIHALSWMSFLDDQGDECAITFVDLTEREKSAKAEKLHSAVWQQTSDYMSIFDLKSKVIAINPALERCLGLTQQDMIGRHIDGLLESRPERSIRGRDGREVRVLASTLPLRDDRGITTAWLVVARDVTQIDALQQQVVQTEKLAAVGQLTSGIAHDVNNLLAAISASAGIMLQPNATHEHYTSGAARISHAARRGADLIKRLLAFSRKADIKPEIISVNAAVSEVADTMQRTLGTNIRIVTALCPSDPHINVDPSMFEGALINLCVNARDAMASGGLLKISVMISDASAPAMHPCVDIRIADTGCGMTPEVQQRVFEPFFTTKQKGMGSGLGLASVYGFVKQSEGAIALNSVVGQGTTFVLSFPLASAVTPRADQQPPPTGPFLGERTILVVEDNDLVRESFSEFLKVLGCRIIQAGNLTAAKQLLKDHPDIEVVVSDLELGNGESGLDLAEWSLAERPDVQGVILSGYLSVALEDIQKYGWSYLSKPVQIEALRNVLTQQG